jgi:hypothetical protein
MQSPLNTHTLSELNPSDDIQIDALPADNSASTIIEGDGADEVVAERASEEMVAEQKIMSEGPPQVGSHSRQTGGRGWQGRDTARRHEERAKPPETERPHRNKTKAAHNGAQIQVAELQQELEQLRKERESLQELLKVRTEELQGIQTFVDTSDKTSIEDVRRMVEQLNAELFQLAASIADSCQYSQNFQVTSNAKDGARDRTNLRFDPFLRQTLGPRMVGILMAARHDKNPYCVQLALQACLAAWVAKLSADWSLAGGEKLQFMRAVYDKIKELGEFLSENNNVC